MCLGAMCFEGILFITAGDFTTGVLRAGCAIIFHGLYPCPVAKVFATVSWLHGYAVNAVQLLRGMIR